MDLGVKNQFMDKSTNPFLVTLRLPVKTSTILLICTETVHFICLFLPWLTKLALFNKILLSVLALISLYYYLSKYPFSDGKNRIAELILSSEGNWQVKMANGYLYRAKLHHSLFVHPWLTIISLVYENKVYKKKREYFIFMPDSLDADLFRRLRVRLRFQVGEQSR